MFTRLKQYVTPVLIILHIVGLVGMIVFPEWNLKSISSLNLLTSLGLILLPAPIHQLWKKILLVFGIGISVEAIGVATGIPFGNYYYGEALGRKIFEVPIIIGVNWFLTAYISYHLAKGFIKNRNALILFSAALMMVLDMFIEPVVHKLDYWYWENTEIPIENYISWFAIGLLCIVIIDRNNSEKVNRSARNLFFIQLVFFAILNLFLP